MSKEQTTQKNKVDYQDFAPQGLSKKERSKLYIGDIFNNAVQCPHCNEIIRSTNRYDFVRCKCRKTFVDGGSWYQRTTPEAISKTEMYE